MKTISYSKDVDALLIALDYEAIAFFDLVRGDRL